MTVFDLINRDISCECGKVHRCDIPHLAIGEGVLEQLPEMLSDRHHILLVADQNTAPLCADRVRELLGERIKAFCLFDSDDRVRSILRESGVIFRKWCSIYYIL